MVLVLNMRSWKYPWKVSTINRRTETNPELLLFIFLVHPKRFSLFTIIENALTDYFWKTRLYSKSSTFTWIGKEWFDQENQKNYMLHVIHVRFDGGSWNLIFHKISNFINEEFKKRFVINHFSTCFQQDAFLLYMLIFTVINFHLIIISKFWNRRNTVTIRSLIKKNPTILNSCPQHFW